MAAFASTAASVTVVAYGVTAVVGHERGMRHWRDVRTATAVDASCSAESVAVEDATASELSVVRGEVEEPRPEVPSVSAVEPCTKNGLPTDGIRECLWISTTNTKVRRVSE